MVLRRTMKPSFREIVMSLVNYNPIVHWPWSGSVTQDISPTLVFKSRDADTEVRVLREVASYGRQIGKLSELLLAVVDALPKDTLKPADRERVDALRLMVDNIERIKHEQKLLPDTLEGARALMADLKKHYPKL
jgi:hypothetical protein